MEQQQNQYKEPLLLLKKYHQYLQNRPHENTEILVHERMIYLIATAIQNKQALPKGIDFHSELIGFINKVNIRVMATQDLNFTQKLNLISKCIDMLFYKPVRSNIKPVEKLLHLRALCFNNLSCIYKQNKQLDDALKSLQVALQIEQTLLTKNYEDTYKSIASTYINKCVILSSLSLHQQAIQTIKTSLDNIERYRQKYGQQINQKQNQQLKHMTMLAYFNMAVEHQHLQQIEIAIKLYQTAFKISKQLQNRKVKNQIMNALKKLKAKK